MSFFRNLFFMSFVFVNLTFAGTLDEVKARGVLNCGIDDGKPGFSDLDDSGRSQGLDVDVCRAVAAAVLGDADAVQYHSGPLKLRLKELGAGQTDIVSGGVPSTFKRDVSLGFSWVGISFIDGYGFLVPKDLGVTSVLELDGATICIEGRDQQQLVSDFFRVNNISYAPVVHEKASELFQQYDVGHCDALMGAKTLLVGYRLKTADPSAHDILPETLSLSITGPIVRQGHENWHNTVQWVLNLMIRAEQLGLSSANIDEINASLRGGAEVSYILDSDWAYQVIKQVGNYGEIFYRNLGEGSDIKLKRGVNALWTEGGLLFSPPFR